MLNELLSVTPVPTDASSIDASILDTVLRLQSTVVSAVILAGGAPQSPATPGASKQLTRAGNHRDDVQSVSIQLAQLLLRSVSAAAASATQTIAGGSPTLSAFSSSVAAPPRSTPLSPPHPAPTELSSGSVPGFSKLVIDKHDAKSVASNDLATDKNAPTVLQLLTAAGDPNKTGVRGAVAFTPRDHPLPISVERATPLLESSSNSTSSRPQPLQFPGGGGATLFPATSFAVQLIANAFRMMATHHCSFDPAASGCAQAQKASHSAHLSAGRRSTVDAAADDEFFASLNSNSARESRSSNIAANHQQRHDFVTTAVTAATSDNEEENHGDFGPATPFSRLGGASCAETALPPPTPAPVSGSTVGSTHQPLPPSPHANAASSATANGLATSTEQQPPAPLALPTMLLCPGASESTLMSFTDATVRLSNFDVTMPPSRSGAAATHHARQSSSSGGNTATTPSSGIIHVHKTSPSAHPLEPSADTLSTSHDDPNSAHGTSGGGYPPRLSKRLSHASLPPAGGGAAAGAPLPPRVGPPRDGGGGRKASQHGLPNQASAAGTLLLLRQNTTFTANVGAAATVGILRRQSFVTPTPYMGPNTGPLLSGTSSSGVPAPLHRAGSEHSLFLSFGAVPPMVRTTNEAVTEDLDVGTAGFTINQYVFVKSLGRGCQGEVFLGVDVDTGAERAIKVVPRPLKLRGLRGAVAAARKAEQLQKEIQIMKRCRHANITALYEVIDDPEHEELYLVMQLARHGSLMSVSAGGTSSRTFGWAKVVHYGRQLCAGLRYLHDRQIVHLDIKPENILLGADDVVYLSDFGISDLIADDEEDTALAASADLHVQSANNASRSTNEASLTESQLEQSNRSHHRPLVPSGGPEHRHRGTLGTTAFLAPESMADATSSKRMSREKLKAVDVWALGMSLYVAAYGVLPWPIESRSQYVEAVQRSDIMYPPIHTINPEASSAPLTLIQLLKEMLCKDPTIRITSEQAHLRFRKVETAVLLSEAPALTNIVRRGWTERGINFETTSSQEGAAPAALLQVNSADIPPPHSA